MSIAHCHPAMTHQGKKLAGHGDYQAIENRLYTSSKLYSLWPATAISGTYTLSGNVPPGLKPMTPSAPVTAITGTLGSFTNTAIVLSAVSQWNNTFDEKIFARTYSAPGSDQGSVTVSSTDTTTLVAKTYNFKILCDGMKVQGPAVVPWSDSEDITLIVFKDWEVDATEGIPLMEAIRDGGARI